jgi:hypothetical protein
MNPKGMEIREEPISTISGEVRVIPCQTMRQPATITRGAAMYLKLALRSITH